MRKLAMALIGVGAVALSYFANNIPVMTPLQRAYSSTCAIMSINNAEMTAYGTGVVLVNDFVITAAHVIDLNNNNCLDDEEKELFIGFDDNSQIVPCDVIAITSWQSTPADVAVLKPTVLTHRPGVLMISDAKYRSIGVGEKITSLNRLGSRPTTIIDGYLLHKGEAIDHSSLTSYFGSSGGGVYNQNFELIGLIEAVAVEGSRVKVQIPAFDIDGIITVFGETEVVLPHNTTFTNIVAVKKLFADNDLEFKETSGIYGPIKDNFRENLLPIWLILIMAGIAYDNRRNYKL